MSCQKCGHGPTEHFVLGCLVAGCKCSKLEKRPSLCEDCPPVEYPTDETRCIECPRRMTYPSTNHQESVK